jgi:hypothetical protein
MSTNTPQHLPELPFEPSDLSQAAVPRRRSGCAWAVGGSLGCLALLLLPVIILLLAGTITVNGVVGGIQGILNPPIVTTAQIVLERISGLSQLTSVKYNYSSLVTSQRDMPDVLQFLYGNKLVMVAVGHISAGIDLSQLTAQSVTQETGVLRVQLPPPALQECFLNEQLSYVISQDTGVFAQELPELSSEARRYALAQFRDNALNEGILNEANTQAQTVLTELLRATAGDVRVEVLTALPSATPTLPETCG